VELLLLSPGNKSAAPFAWDDNGPLTTSIDLERVIAVARRQWRLVAVVAIIGMVIGVAYIITAVPKYTATASILIGGNADGLVNRLSMDQASADDDAAILSQVELLKSDTIGLAVVAKLNLAQNQQFLASDSSALDAVKILINTVLNIPSMFVSANLEQIDEDKDQRRALAVVQRNMTITRVGRTYVLDVGFTSPSRDIAASVSNAIADIYINDKLEAKYDATRRASDWLQARIDELRQKSLNSDLAVQKYRADNGLLAANGNLIADQQLSELNTALITVQAETAKSRAKYEQIQQIIASGQTDAIVPEVLDSSVSNDLRQKYLADAKLEADISGRLGPDHIRAVRLREEMAEYRRQMFDELNRIKESYKNELDVAQAREETLKTSVDKAKVDSASAGESGVQLRELERSSEAYKNLYQTFLQRYQEAIQQQSFPISEARIITRPVKPESPSYPRKLMVLALFGFVGAVMGSGMGAVRELRDRYFRTGDQIRAELNLEYLGSLPFVGEAKVSRKGDDGPVSGRLWKNSSLANYVVDYPLSNFAETLRSAKIGIDMRKAGTRGRVVGVVAALPGEGKSTVAINLAELVASQGAKAVLIDCDFRNPGATRTIAGHAEQGLLEIALGTAKVEDLVLVSEQTGLAFVPAVIRHRVPHSAELLTSATMREFLDIAREKFEYVILDLPPLAPVVDARRIEPLVDDFVFVVEWGKTSRKFVQTTLERDADINDKCAGVILNKVDTKKMMLYEGHESEAFYLSRYSAYYTDAR
jgi:succinoglycan biosynthesis transport protein ExoP